MAVLTSEELIEKVKARIGEDTSDEAISFLEDVTDTIADYNDKLKEDWKTKYEENDKEWRKRYTDRFNGEDIKPPKIDEDEVEIKTYEDLFSIKE